MKRQVLDYYRRQARRPEVSSRRTGPRGPRRSRFFEESDGHWRRRPEPPPAGKPPTGPWSKRSCKRPLHRRQERLPARHGAVFALRFVEESPAEEICRALSLSAANYWVIIHRAKLQLRRCLEQHGLGRRAEAPQPYCYLPCCACSPAATPPCSSSSAPTRPWPRGATGAACGCTCAIAPHCHRYAHQTVLLVLLAQARAAGCQAQLPGLPDAARQRIRQQLAGAGPRCPVRETAGGAPMVICPGSIK
ncbi:MAG: sigma factor-like helix-turn-helix DNA-binding protein [Hymenobacter sp.]